jgi:hypothetical protein
MRFIEKMIVLVLLTYFFGPYQMHAGIDTNTHDMSPQSRGYTPIFKPGDHASIGLSTIVFENSIGIDGDTVLVDVPKIFIDGKLVVCTCGRQAVMVTIRFGVTVAYCLMCAPRRASAYGMTRDKPNASVADCDCHKEGKK